MTDETPDYKLHVAAGSKYLQNQTGTNTWVNDPIEETKLDDFVVSWPEMLSLEEPEWAIDQILPKGSQTHLFGPAGVGKSLLALQLALCCLEGSPFLGQYETQKQRVLWIDYENGKWIMRDRIESYGYKREDFDWFHTNGFRYATYPEIGALNTEEAAWSITNYIRDNRIDLVIIDSMGLAFNGDENSSDTYRDFGRWLGAMCRERSTTLLMMDNTGHTNSEHARGSSRKRDEADIQWGLTKLSDDTYQITNHKDRLGGCPKAISLKTNHDPFLRWSTHKPKEISKQAAEIVKQMKENGAVPPFTKRAIRYGGYGGTERYVAEAARWLKAIYPNGFEDRTK